MSRLSSDRAHVTRSHVTWNSVTSRLVRRLDVRDYAANSTKILAVLHEIEHTCLFLHIYIQQVKRCTTANSSFQYAAEQFSLRLQRERISHFRKNSFKAKAWLNSGGRIRSNRPNKLINYSPLYMLRDSIAFTKGYINLKTMVQPSCDGDPTQSIGPAVSEP